MITHTYDDVIAELADVLREVVHDIAAIAADARRGVLTTAELRELCYQFSPIREIDTIGAFTFAVDFGAERIASWSISEFAYAALAYADQACDEPEHESHTTYLRGVLARFEGGADRWLEVTRIGTPPAGDDV